MRYLTKDWYIACQTDPMTPEVQKRLDEIDRAYCAAQTREALPDGLRGAFSSMTARYGRSSPEQTSRSASTARILNTIP